MVGMVETWSGTKPNSKTDHRREGLTSTEKGEREKSRPHTGTLGTEDPLGRQSPLTIGFEKQRGLTLQVFTISGT